MKAKAKKVSLQRAASKNKIIIETVPDALDEAFPNIDPQFKPLGSRLIVQLRSPKTKMGKIILVDETQENEMWNTQIGKVRAIGPEAFKNRDTWEAWPGGNWCAIGDYIRIPKFNQDRWFVELENGKQVLFMLIRDVDILAIKTGDPLEIKSYIH